MNEFDFHEGLLLAWFLLAAVTFLSLFFVTAPYGRHTRPGWGPSIKRHWGWFLMELPSPLLFGFFFLIGHPQQTLVAWVFLLLWEIHYIHRAFIYPFQMRGKPDHMTLIPVLLAIVFNGGNAYLNGRFLFSFQPVYSVAWLTDVRFLGGLFMFLSGFVLNKHSDWILKNLRKPGETRYKIPQGGLYRYVSCPNYLGEIVQWMGWALLTWSLAGLSFGVWTLANLGPRAWAHHKWYLKTFPDYPKYRRALVPFIF